MSRTMSDPIMLAGSLLYMERKALRRTSRDRRSPYSQMWRLRELELTEANGGARYDKLTPLGETVLQILDCNHE